MNTGRNFSGVGRGGSARKPKRQLGQAIPLGIAVMLFSTALVLALFNTGQMTSEKMRLANTADAAAYSGMVWQARSLNFQAYTNRAMVANQVAIAQFVSFVSWTKYLDIGARNFDTIGNFIWFLKPFSAAFRQVAEAINEIMTTVANIAIPVIDGLIEVLSASQTVVHYAAAATTWDIVQEVVRQNDPNYGLTALTYGFLASNDYQWLNFTDQYDANAMLTRMQDVTMRSRDGFSTDRGWTLRGPNLGIVEVRLRKGGETRLLSDGDANARDQSDLEWEWKSKDTLSIHTRWWCPTWRNPRRFCNQEIPVAWGAAYASTTNEDFCAGGASFFQQTGNCGSNSWTPNERAERLADTDDPISLDGYSGIRPYRDMSGLNEDEISDDTHDPRLSLAVEVYKPGNAVRTSTVAGIGSPGNPEPARSGIGPGVFRLNDNFAGGEMNSISKAEVFFRRPSPRSDGRLEYANLFNPYWDVHLTSARGERIAAWLIKGVGDITGAIGGGGAVPGI